MNTSPAEVGASINEIETPALVVDLDAFDGNLRKMDSFARSAGVRLRPHAKTHKCPTIALKQIAAGAIGQCCQTTGEAEALIRGGVRDVLVTNSLLKNEMLWQGHAVLGVPRPLRVAKESLVARSARSRY